MAADLMQRLQRCRMGGDGVPGQAKAPASHHCNGMWISVRRFSGLVRPGEFK